MTTTFGERRVFDIASPRAQLMQLIKLVEFGNDWRFRCTRCEHSDILTRDALVGPRRVLLKATFGEVLAKVACAKCGRREVGNWIIDGHYHFDLSDRLPFDGRRTVYVRRVLAEAGLDPAEYGYPPLAPADCELWGIKRGTTIGIEKLVKLNALGRRRVGGAGYLYGPEE